MSFNKKALIAIAFAMLLSLIYPLFSIYLFQYSASDGFRLPNGHQVGGDFVTFYQAGEMVRTEPERLYDFEYYLGKQDQFYEKYNIKKGKLVFAYPPLVGYLFSLLPRGTLLISFLSWTVLSLILFFGSLVLLLRSIKASSVIIAAAIFSSLGFYCFSLYCIGNGQTSSIGTVILVVTFLLYIREKYFIAGLVLSLAYYKPPLFLGFVLTLFFSRNWRLILGFLTGGIILVATTIGLFGYNNFLYYISRISNYRYGENLTGATTLTIEKGVGLLAALEGLKVLPSNISQLLVLTLAIITSFLLGNYYFRRDKNIVFQTSVKNNILLFTIAVSLSLLFSFQMVVYDLSILFPFVAATTIIFLKEKSSALFNILYFASITAIFYDFYIRSIPIGDLVLKGTTIIWSLLTLLIIGKSSKFFKCTS